MHKEKEIRLVSTCTNSLYFVLMTLTMRKKTELFVLVRLMTEKKLETTAGFLEGYHWLRHSQLLEVKSGPC